MNYIKIVNLLLILCVGQIVAREIGLQPGLRVIGGTDAPQGWAPYQVSIMNTFGEHVCGGAILNQRYVATAAHCLEWPIQYLKVITGTNAYLQPDAEYLVDAAKIHCQHNKPQHHNDIALIHTATPIVFNAKTQPVQLPTSNTLKAGDKVILTGWGSTQTWGRYATQLQKVDLAYIDNSECKSKVRNAAWVGDGHICTYTKAGEGSCHGDSGGPLVDEDQVLRGIVSWGEACAIGYPDVFSNVAYYRNWIDEMMTDDGHAC